MTSSLIGTAIISIVVAAFSITMTGFQQSSRALAQKMEISQLQSNIKGRLADANLCGCNLIPVGDLSVEGVPITSGGAFMPTGENAPAAAKNIMQHPPVSFPTLYGRCSGTTPSNPILQSGQPLPNSLTGLEIETVSFGKFQWISGTTFSGTLEVKLNSGKLTVSRKPMEIPLTMEFDLAQAKLTSCSSKEPPPPGGVSGNPIPPTLAGDPGTQCRWGSSSGPLGINMYRAVGATNGNLPANAAPYRLCCMIGIPSYGFGVPFGANEGSLMCAAGFL